MRIRTWLAVMFAALVSVMAVSPAHADTAYWQQMANGLRGQYVYQDPSVNLLSDQQIVAFNDLITQSAHPIYIVVVDQSKAGGNTTGYPDEMHAAFQNSGAYAVVGLKTFQASAYDVPNADVARAVPKAATSAVSAAKARGAKGPDVQMIRDWVDSITEMDWTIGDSPSLSGDNGSTGIFQDRPSADSSGGVSGWMIFWIVFAVLFVLCGIALAFWLMTRTRSDDEDELQYMPSSYSSPSYSTTSRRSPRSGRGGNQPNPGTHKTNKKDHYFGGGTDSNGRYYPPGYYSSMDPFWTYLVWENMLNHDRSDYDRGYRDAERDSDRSDRNDSSSNDDSTGYSSGGSGGGDWAATPTYTPPAPTKSHSSGSSGGGDWASSPSPTPSFDFGGGSSGSSSGFSSGGSGGGDF